MPDAPPPAAVAAAAAALLPAPGRDPWTALAGFRANAAPDARVAVTIDGHAYVAEPIGGGNIADVGGERVLFLAGDAWPIAAPTADRRGGEGEGDGAILAPMPGRILSVAVAAGDSVSRGQRLLVVEAMKMEHALVAPFAGTVAELAVREGQQVAERTLLARIDPD